MAASYAFAVGSVRAREGSLLTRQDMEGLMLAGSDRELASLLRDKGYGDPAGRMTVVGVTGTNGKTTTTYLLKQLLERCLGAKVGLIGTNQNVTVNFVVVGQRDAEYIGFFQRFCFRVFLRSG